MLNGYHTPLTDQHRVTPICRGWGHIVGWGRANAKHIVLHVPDTAALWGMNVDFEAAIQFHRQMPADPSFSHPNVRIYVRVMDGRPHNGL